MTKHWRILLTLAAILGVVGYGLWNQASVRHFPGKDNLKVKVVAAKKISTPAVIEAVGQLQTTQQRDVVSVVPGVVKEIRNIGDRVKAGEVVAFVDSKSLTERLRANETAVKAAAARLLEVKRRLDETERKLAVVREAYGKELIARRDLEVVESAAETAQVENERAQAQVAQSEAALAQTRYLSALTRVVAPVSGIIVSRTDRGTSVSAYARIMTLADVTTMRVAIPLPAADARFVHAGVAVKVGVPELRQKTFEGRVSRVTMATGAEVNGSSAEIEVQNNNGTLKPGLEALISVPLEREQITIPSAAVFELQGISCVYVIADQRAVLRRITTALRESTDIVVTSNLAEGEKVVVEARNKLKPGDSVRIFEQ
jgi:HlyD family secretion protein